MSMDLPEAPMRPPEHALAPEAELPIQRLMESLLRKPGASGWLSRTYWVLGFGFLISLSNSPMGLVILIGRLLGARPRAGARWLLLAATVMPLIAAVVGFLFGLRPGSDGGGLGPLLSVPWQLGIAKALVFAPLLPLLALAGALRRTLKRGAEVAPFRWIGAGLVWTLLVGLVALLAPVVLGWVVDEGLRNQARLGLASNLGAFFAVLLAQHSLAGLKSLLSRLETAVAQARRELGPRGFSFSSAPGGTRIVGRDEDLPVMIAIQDGIVPALVIVEVQVPALAPWPALSVRARKGEKGVPLRDPVLSQALRVRGIEPEQAEALLGDQHERLLPVIAGRPGSRIEGDRVVLEARLPPGDWKRWPSIASLVDEAVALGRVLQERAALATGPATARKDVQARVAER